MKRKQIGSGVQYIYDSREEIEEAAKKANATLQFGHNTTFFTQGTAPFTQIHLYNERSN